jgi:hypothetical protein
MVSGVLTRSSDLTSDVLCKGNQDRHKKPIVSEAKVLFGLIKQIYTYYPETDTRETIKQYIGPRNKCKLWFAIVFGPKGSHDGVIINDKFIWWDLDGFYGDGLKEFENL